MEDFAKLLVSLPLALSKVQKYNSSAMVTSSIAKYLNEE